MNFQRLKALAKSYVVAAKEAAPIAALQAKLDEQVATNASLQDQIDKLVKKIERMQAKAAA
jgi:cell division protein FtsB